MNKLDHPDDLGSLLRAHDPAENRALTDQEARLMRSRVIEASSPPVSAGWRRPLWALAVLIAVLAVASNLNQDTGTHEVATEPAVSRATPETQDEPTVRRIQYETPGGTRVIWTLDSDFEL